jgi:hypothetical protein
MALSMRDMAAGYAGRGRRAKKCVEVEALKPMRESRPTMSTTFDMRFVHAAPGVGALDFGVSDAAKLPANLTVPFFRNIAFGATSPAGTSPGGKIDGNGYLEVQAGGGKLLLAAAPAGKVQASLAFSHTFDNGSAYTMFIVGTETRPDFPTEIRTCDETKITGPLAKCGNGIPKDLTVDVVNLQLNGAFAVYESSRRKPAIDAVAALGSDVVCVTEIWSDADKQAIVDAAKAQYPHSYFAKHDWSTKVDDPKDAQGQTPPEPSAAPCAQSAPKMKTALDCIRDNCASPAGSEDGKAAEGFSSCLTSKCAAGGLLPLLTGTPEDRACWSCIFTQILSYETVSFVRDKCATEPRARHVFRGADGILLLSKYPIAGPEAWVLPATEWRVSVYRAPVTLDNGANLDAYCTVLTTPATSCLTRPYTGAYGNNGKDCIEQWTNELILQSGKLVSWVKAKSVALKAKAVVAGEFCAGPGYNDGTKDVLKARYPDAYSKLVEALAVGIPEGYVPKCTFCANNPIITPPPNPPTGDSSWTTMVLLGNIPVTTVRSAEITLKAPVVSVTGAGDAGTLMIPVSSYYGFRSVLRIEP